MRLIDMQISVNGTAANSQYAAQAQAAQTYRYLSLVDQARKINLHRQESTQPAAALSTAGSVSDPMRVRSYANRVKREEKEPERRFEMSSYTGMMWKMKGSDAPQYIDFSA
jgi:hypothetical protein